MSKDTTYIDSLKIEFGKCLPGKVAQRLMSPLRRFPINESPDILKSKVGAVLILLYRKNHQWHIPLILRPTYDGEHSGQISLPGGKVEADDKTTTHTALRETQEEIGIKTSQIEVIGQLTTIYIPKSNYIVHPFVGYLNSKPNFIADKKEVEKILEMPLSILTDKTKIGEYLFEKDGIQISAPCWNFEEHKIWGATAMILSELNSLIAQNIDS